MEEVLIEVNDLTKRFKGQSSIKALNKINLKIYKKDICGIIGLSGAGKSTLMRCLTALDKPCEGAIYIEGENLAKKNPEELNQARKNFGMVFQHFHLFSSRTVADNIAYPMEIHGFSKIKIQSRIDELLALVGLENKKHAYPTQLSGGEKQRVGIARALATHPRILFCDEPTSALDPHTTHSLLQLLLDLNRKLDLTIVIITHQLEVIKQICNRVAVLSQGSIVEEGPVKEVFTRPSHPLTRQLIYRDVEKLPEDLLKGRCGTKKLIRLSFEGHKAKQPILSHMIKHCNVEANILFGGLDYLQQTLIGNLFIELSGTPEEIHQALQFLNNQHIQHEVIDAN